MLDIQGTQALRQRTGILFVLVLIGHLILISAQVQSEPGVPALEAATFGVFSRVQATIAGVLDVGRNGWGNYIALRGAREENEGLKRQLAEMQVRLHEERALAARTRQLQALMELKESTSLPTIAADVIAGNPNPGVLTVTVDRGSADGVQTDMAVMSAAGIVGRVIGRPAAHAARVQLLIDPAAAAGAVIERSRVGGMVVGVDTDPPLQLQLVSNMADVIPGDAVVTSGADGVYPRGFPIGSVERSERGNGLYRLITVRPAVDFASLEEVLIVLEPARPAAPRVEAVPPAKAEK
jgi:rod shape-determining protein MreC